MIFPIILNTGNNELTGSLPSELYEYEATIAGKTCKKIKYFFIFSNKVLLDLKAAIRICN